MAISFKCPHCSRDYRVGNELAGRLVKCKDCAEEIHVPREGDYSRSTPSFSPRQAPRRDSFGVDDDIDDAPYNSHRPAMPARVRPSSRAANQSGGIDDTIWRLVAVAVFLAVAVPIGIVTYNYFTNRANHRAPVPVPVSDGPQNPQQNSNGDGNGAPQFNVNSDNSPPPPQVGGPGIHITLSDGWAMQATTPFGRPMAAGVEFVADYQMTDRPAGVFRYRTVIRARNSRATDHLTMLHGSGTLGGTVFNWSQNDGPFELYIEAETISGSGPRTFTVSNSLQLPWKNVQPEQNQSPFPQPGSYPGQQGPGNNPGPQGGYPGGRSGYPGQQGGGYPGAPGYRPPQVPGMPPPFGPRGRR